MIWWMFIMYMLGSFITSVVLNVVMTCTLMTKGYNKDIIIEGLSFVKKITDKYNKFYEKILFGFSLLWPYYVIKFALQWNDAVRVWELACEMAEIKRQMKNT